MRFYSHSRFVYGVASAVTALSLFGGASFAQASSLTSSQVQAVVNLLQAFGANQTTITDVQVALTSQAAVPMTNHDIQPTNSSNSGSVTETSHSTNDGAVTHTTTTTTQNGVTQTSDTTSNGDVVQITGGLHAGMSGENVKRLQEVLSSDSDIFAKDNVTGFFGPKTQEALKHFQTHFGIDPAGVVGPKTMDKINELLDEHNIQEGDTISADEFGNLGDLHDSVVN